MEGEMIRNCIVLGVKYNYICKKVVVGNEIGFFMLYRNMLINWEIWILIEIYSKYLLC